MASCSCGEILEAGVCVLADGLDSLDQVLEQACESPGSKECLITGNKAICVCKCGFQGDFCEEAIEILGYNYGIPLFSSYFPALMFLVPILLFPLMFWLSYRNKEKNEEIFNIDPRGLVVPRFEYFNQYALLAFRLSMVALVISIHTQSIVVFDFGDVYRTFTHWNWSLFTFIFLYGSYMSIKNLRTNEFTDSKIGLSTQQKAYYVIVGVEFSAAIFISLIFWLVLFPEAQAIDEEGDLLNFRSFVTHGVNVFLLLFEILCTNIRIHVNHMGYAICWGCLYLLFHSIALTIQDISGDSICPEYGLVNPSDPFFGLFATALLVMAAICFLIAMLVNFCKPKNEFVFVDNAPIPGKTDI